MNNDSTFNCDTFEQQSNFPVDNTVKNSRQNTNKINNFDFLSPAAQKIYTRYLNANLPKHRLQLEASFNRMSLEELESYLCEIDATQYIDKLYKQNYWALKQEKEKRQKIKRKIQPRPRDNNPEPREFIQYSNMSTYFTRNTRIADGDFRLLNLINAFCGKSISRHFNVESLAKHLGVTGRTIHRRLARLRETGAIITEKVRNPRTGMIACIKITLCHMVRKCLSNKTVNRACNRVKQGMTNSSNSFKKISNELPKMSDINISINITKKNEEGT
jgi:DNA-binding transcriptional ArsR family regulator